MKRFLSALVAGWLVVQPVFADNKPSLIIAPFKGKSSIPAMDAIETQLRKSDRVFIVDLEKVIEYIDATTPKVEKKSTKAATAAFDSGKKAYQELNIQKAIEYFEKSKAAYFANLVDENSFEGLRTTQFYLGMCYLANKNEAKATVELRQMILLDPRRDQTKPSEKYYSPNIRALYQKVLKEVKAGESGNVHIQTTPGHASILFDGVMAGTTPFDIQNIPVGKHYFRLVNVDTQQTEFVEKEIVGGSNDIEIAFKVGGPADVYSYFQTTTAQKGLDQERATYLDEMGLALGADIFLFLTPLQGKVRGQLYDQRSQELSREVVETSPQSLVQKLMESLGDDGYVVAAKEGEAVGGPAPPLSASGVELKAADKGAGIDYAEPKAETTNKWYKNKWIWIGIGGGVLALGSVLYATDVINFDSSYSTVQVTVP